jgi:hypothetical protein
MGGQQQQERELRPALLEPLGTLARRSFVWMLLVPLIIAATSTLAFELKETANRIFSCELDLQRWSSRPQARYRIVGVQQQDRLLCRGEKKPSLK